MSMPEIPSSPPPTSGSLLLADTSELQGLLNATRCHQTSSASSEPERLPVVKKSNEMRGNGNIIVPEKDKFTWRSVLDPVAGTGLKMKFVRERVKSGSSKDKDKGQKIEFDIDRPKGHSNSAGKGMQSLSKFILPPGLTARAPVPKQPNNFRTRAGGKENNSTARKRSMQKPKFHLPWSGYYKAGPVVEDLYTSIPVLLPLQGKLIKTRKFVLKRRGVFGRLPLPMPSE
jgi:hypothetical protein